MGFTPFQLGWDIGVRHYVNHRHLMCHPYSIKKTWVQTNLEKVQDSMHLPLREHSVGDGPGLEPSFPIHHRLPESALGWKAV